ncbi:hypothetical protein HOP61_08195 [Halomonas daqingensis]|uniref:Uncharacterized protein n=1 Tax=Billgrantia desiderata TaxID=52021 RepID=A0AAW4YSN7_9GAMM|nr:hypothetical protein [Halomonas desiderata]MCE8051269.1 hypothetical protein [Halomonas desiderata]
MIDLGSTEFLIRVQSLPEKDFELYSSWLFDEWEASVERALSIPDYYISLVIEEGSISGRAKIAAVAGAIYMGVANYGGFVSGLQTIHSQVKYVNSLLFENAKAPFDCTKSNVKVKNSGGAISSLNSLFRKVQKGVLTVEEAMFQVMKIFGEEGENVPGFVEQLERELNNLPRYPKQLSFIDADVYECEELVGDIKADRPSRERSPKPIPVSQQYRIEIWRESKKSKKQVKFSRN